MTSSSSPSPHPAGQVIKKAIETLHRSLSKCKDVATFEGEIDIAFKSGESFRVAFLMDADALS